MTRGRVYQATWRCCFWDDGYKCIHFLKCGGSSPAVQLCLICDVSDKWKYFKLYALNLCNLLYVSYITKKLIKFKKQTNNNSIMASSENDGELCKNNKAVSLEVLVHLAWDGTQDPYFLKPGRQFLLASFFENHCQQEISETSPINLI